MKTLLTAFLFLVTGVAFAQQPLSDFKYVIVPKKYDFQKSENEFRLNTMTKFNLEKMGFVCYYEGDIIPKELAMNPCNLLKVDVIKDNTLTWTRLFVVLKDCQNQIIAQSELGKSKQKDLKLGYTEAFNAAFVSLLSLNYKYSGDNSSTVQAVEKSKVDQTPIVEVVVPIETESGNFLFAQPIQNGFQLVDSSPKIVFKLQKTNLQNVFLASKGSQTGVLFLKSSEWYFEYYQNEKLISERVKIKF